MMRTLILSLVSCSALIAVAGCSAEVPSNEDVQVSAEDDVVSTKATLQYWTTCSGASTSTHHQATDLVRYVFGAAMPAFPAGAACDEVKAALTDLRNGFNDGTPMTVVHTTMAICGIDTAVVRLGQNGYLGAPTTSTLLNSVVQRLNANTDACFGAGVHQYLAPITLIDGKATLLYMDPEPATLTADLSSTQGAAAAAYWSTSLEPTTAKKWNSIYGACGTAVNAAEPCSTTALYSGQQATRMIQKNGTLCRCL